jgi:hypothetical protein
MAQQGFSCSQQTALYYLLAGAWHRQYGGTSRGANQLLSPYQAYAALSDGRTGRSHVVDGWLLAREMGVPTLSDMPRFSRSLMHGYEKYRRALLHRPKSWTVLPMDNAGDVAAARIRLAAGDLLACDFQIKGTALKRLPSGHTVVQRWGSTGSGHSMLYAGYDDQLGWDTNGDGAITTDKDITGDGRVTLADAERGAFLLINPWGPRWGDGGRAWVLYREHAVSRWPWAHFVATVQAAPPAHPELMLKVTLQANARDAVLMTVGSASNTVATRPSSTISPLIFRREPASSSIGNNVWEAFASLHRSGPHLSGGPLAQANGQPLEMGLDLSALPCGERYFLDLPGLGRTWQGGVIAASVREYDRQGRLLRETPLISRGGRWMSGP